MMAPQSHRDKTVPSMIADVLVRSRWNRIAISADIEKAFLMISIQESHRDMLRFLWLKDPFVLNSEVTLGCRATRESSKTVEELSV